jgi:hypothetical protein
LKRKFLLLLLLLLCWPFRGVARASDIQRVAIVVGANDAPPGRSALRYAHEDARRVAEVLIAVAGFASSDVKVLLDPEPGALLALLDSELSAAAMRSSETLLLFYYSGHADERSIFPKGQILPFAALRARLEDRRVKLRIGLVDSCRGGSWTGSKGLKKVEPFEVDAARGLAEEGSVLIASSAGQENAHETEALHGSFFTHYWNSGLRGAADRSGDGVVTLSEAFEYARSLTIRDTALAGQSPQHPSFQMKLAGRRDFPLVTLAEGRTTLLFEQEMGPVELVRLSDGLVVVESTRGARTLRLGLPAGSYLVRRRAAHGVWARAVALTSGSTTYLKESELEPTRVQSSLSKGDSGPDAADITWKGERLYASLALGVRHAPNIDPGLRLGAADGNGVFMLRTSARLARAFWLSAPLALVADLEQSVASNAFLWGGLPVLSVSDEPENGVVARGFVGFGADARLRARARHVFNVNGAALGAIAWTRSEFIEPNTWTAQLAAGISESIPSAVTFNFGVSVGLTVLSEGHFTSAAFASTERNAVLALGSVQRMGLRPLPLIHVPVSESWAIDAHAVAAYQPALRGWVETYTAAVSYQH